MTLRRPHRWSHIKPSLWGQIRLSQPRFIRTVDGGDDDGTRRYGQRELTEGDVIADGTTTTEGYGATPVERAQFLAETIRIHLARQACSHHGDDLSSIHALLGTAARWCPSCGTRLPTR